MGEGVFTELTTLYVTKQVLYFPVRGPTTHANVWSWQVRAVVVYL